MNREEIKYASKDYLNHLLDKQEYHNEIYTEHDIQDAFEKGAMFVYNNPDLSAIWHDAIEEEPKKGEYILVEVVNTLVPNEIGYHVQYVEEWMINLMKTEGFKCRWAYIKDLLPKGGEK